MEVDDDVRRFVDASRPAAPARRRDPARDAPRDGPVASAAGDGLGYGEYHYRYESGREGDAAAAAFAPRKAATVVYLMDGVAAHTSDLAKLGPHTTGVGCVYLKNLDDVDLEVLATIRSRTSRSTSSRFLR